MTRSDIVRQLNAEYATLREENARLWESRVDEVIAQAPEAEEYIRGGAALLQRSARELLAHPENAAQLAQATRQQVRDNDAALKRILARLHRSENYLDPIYRCPICRDRGYVGDGVRTECACFTRQVTERLFETSGAVTRETFDRFDERIYPDGEPLRGGLTQRDMALAARNLCQQYVREYPRNPRSGVLLMGGTGLGKTYLLNCVHNALIQKGCVPVRATAYRLFEAMQSERFGRDGGDFRQMLSCDALLIDDLGSEPMVQGVTREYLFTLLNERLSQRRHTVIATNLTGKDLLTAYGERVFSRLMDRSSMFPVELAGKDLRLYGQRTP